MPVTGKGRAFGVDFGPEDLVARLDLPALSPGAVVANDWLWGNAAPPVTEIPYAWLKPPVRFRTDNPLNVATVTQSGGVIGRKRDSASADVGSGFGEWEFTATLQAAVAADAANLATHIVGNYATQPNDVPRQRCPSLTIDLVAVYDLVGPAGVWRVLAREIGDRILISGTPTGSATAWPQGTTTLIIEGIQHQVAADTRVIVWSTTPVVGASAGAPGPWFRLDTSTTDIGSDELAF